MDYFLQKFGVTAQNLEGTLASLRTTLNRFHTVRTKKLYDDIYLIDASNSGKARVSAS